MNHFRNHPLKFPGLLSEGFLAGFLIFTPVVRAEAPGPVQEPGERINIGLLVNDNKSVAARQGAEIAVIQANRKGGLNGKPFELVVRSMEGPWGTGSKQAVDLIFTEKVWALLGSHDGRNAHLVEQAATKSIVPFISAWAGDPTLSQAFVPWFFNCVPNDIQQAEVLYNEIYVKRRMSTEAIISGSDYDSQTALKNFLKKTRQEQKNDPVQFRLDDYKGRMAELVKLAANSGAECFLLLCNPSEALEFLEDYNQLKLKVPLFSLHYILNEDILTGQERKQIEDKILFTLPEWPVNRNKVFADEYFKTYGSKPGMAAMYAYDAACVIIEAIRDAGISEREQLQKSLRKIVYEGVTGTISFDEKGNRKGPFIISLLKDGIPSIADK